MNTKSRIIFSVLLLLALAATATAAETMPLAGEWRFALDPHDAGTNQGWFAKSLPDKIRLPGVLESQGYGDPISIHTPWVLSLYDHFWYLRADYAAYTNAGNVKVPFLCQPPRHYLGAAWYQRDVKIPASWKGKRVVLFLERPHWKSTVWLDDREIGSDISLCTPHEYDFGIVPPGKHRLTIRVDNRMILPYRPDAHSISDSLDDAWNGIIGKIALQATSPVWIDEVQIFPNVKGDFVTARIRVGNITGKAGSGKILFGCGTAPSAETQTIEELTAMTSKSVTWETNGATIELQIPLGDYHSTWDEFHPNLRELRLELKGDSANDSRSTVFGLRDFHTDGNQFILNGRPVYFRGTHFGGDFPLTGYPPTDVAAWKKIIETCKSYGLNHIRFHSWCPPEAAFEAADELGFYFQVECGMWNEFSPGGVMEKQLYSETDRILRDFGNHPSLMLISASNEAHGHWMQVLPQWVEHYRALDPRHLYTPDTGWVQIQSPGPVTGADYLVAGRIGRDRTRGETGWFGRDYGSSLRGVNVPVIAHELGQWCAYPDFDVIQKFTGFMRPGNFEIFRDSAAAHGLLPENKQFAQASGRFQLECYKEEIEANLRTPGMGGFQLLDLHDYTGQGTALVGLLDPFWESKGYVTPAEFKEFCNTVVPLARLKQRVFTTADKLEVPVDVANYGPQALTNMTVIWRILDETGAGKAIGISNNHTIPIGKSRLEMISTDFKSLNLPAPGEYKLQIYLQNTPFTNNWNFWLYPSQISDAVPTNVLVTSSWTAAERSLADGGQVLFLPNNSDLDWRSPPLARVPIFWNALMGPTWSRMLGLWCDTNSPALAEFPTEPNCDWQWTELLHDTRAVNLDHLPRSLKPIVSAIDDWNRNYKLGVIFEARVGRGKLLVCSIDLNGNSSPVAQQLRRSLLDYMAGDAASSFKHSHPESFTSVFANPPVDHFQPQTEITLAQFESLYFDSRIMHQLGATATADGQNADAIVDGDPNTFWSSADARGRTAKPPHTIDIAFPHPVAMTGLVLMNRQNQREHQGDIRSYSIESSGDGTNWRQITTGKLASTWDPQTIRFSQMLTTRHLRLTARSGVGTDESSALAELAVIYAGPKLAEDSAGNMEYKNTGTASPDIDAGGDRPNFPRPPRRTKP